MVPVMITFTRNPANGGPSFPDSVVTRSPVSTELMVEKLRGSSPTQLITSPSGKQYYATNVRIDR